MKTSINILLLILLFLCSCQSKTTTNIELKEATQKQQTPEKKIPIWKIGQDSLLEKNNPKNLDLNKHQLFIDTTRTSTFYKAYFDWNPGEFDEQAIAYYTKEIAKKYKPNNITIGDFPNTWITLEKLNGEFVIYDRCDGISTRYFINNNSLNSYDIEADCDLIHKLIKLTEDELQIELRTIPQKSKSEKGILTIRKTNYDYVYLLKISYDEYEFKSLVTPLKHVKEFDLVVNHCIKNKRPEFNGFDKINYDEY